MSYSSIRYEQIMSELLFSSDQQGISDSSLPVGTVKNSILGTESLFSNNLVPKKCHENMGYLKSIELCEGNDRWYIDINFFDVIKKEYQRKRIFKKLNSYRKAADRRKAGNMMIKVFKKMISEGWNPLTNEYIPEKVENAHAENKPDKNCIWLITYYLRDVQINKSTDTLRTYKKNLAPFQRWLAEKGYGTLDVNQITNFMVRTYLNDYKVKHEWSNKTRNNNYTTLNTFFLYAQSIYQEERLIDIVPTRGIGKLRVETVGNLPFNEKEFKMITEYMRTNEPYLLKFCQGVYYTAMRPQKELRNLLCMHIDFEGNRIRIPSELDKNNNPEYIPLDPVYKETLIEMGVDKADSSYYIYSHIGSPGPMRLSEAWTQTRFKRVRETLKMDEKHSIYGFKHTRGGHLYDDTKDIIFIQKLFRHSDIRTTMIYLKSIGRMIVSDQFQHSRKF